MWAAIISQNMVETVGWMLVHSVWQGLAVALLLALLLRMLRGATAHLRYAFCCGALLLIVLTPPVTMLIRTGDIVEAAAPETALPEQVAVRTSTDSDLPESITPIAETASVSNTTQAASPGWTEQIHNLLECSLPYLVVGWLAGIFGLSMWRLGGWTQLQLLKRRMVRPVSTFWRDRLSKLTCQLGITRTVQALESAWVEVPTVVGWLKPVVLIPATALAGIHPRQLEAILLHELAHIRRLDYLVNLVQTVVETLVFYHPAAWWISRRIRIERENCCDDVAAAAVGDTICYARALTEMEELRGRMPRLGVAAAGGSLLHRITRLAGGHSQSSGGSGWITPMAMLLLIAAIAIPAVLAAQPPTALELLDHFTATQDTLRSFVIMEKIEHEGQVSNDHAKWTSLIDERTDGSRFTLREKRWGDLYILKGVSKDTPHYTSYLFDNKVSFDHVRQYGKAGRVVIRKLDDSEKKDAEKITGDLSRGYALEDHDRVDLVLRQAAALQVRKNTQNINGWECYVLEGVTDRGRYTLWIDPQHGYHLAKAIVRREKGNTCGTKDVTIVSGTIIHTLDKVRFKQSGGIWVPVEAHITYSGLNVQIRDKKSGDPSQTTAIPDQKSNEYIQITEISINPDHEALGSFVPNDIPDGAKVYFADEEHKKPEGGLIEYTWQNGQVLDSQGKVTYDSGSRVDKSQDLDGGKTDAFSADPPTRILHFPGDRSLGLLKIQDASIQRKIETFCYWEDGANWYMSAETLGEARGDVTVPAGKRVGLFVNQALGKNLEPLKNLRPDDLYMLSIAEKLADNSCMPYIAHLTGLKILDLTDTPITNRGMEWITKLQSLEYLSLPKSIANQGLAHVSRLPNLKGLYFRTTQVTNQGLEHLAEIQTLEELALGGEGIGDAGLKHLAKLPRLNYLLLSGNHFTNEGLAHLQAVPSLRILHLGWMPIVNGVGMAHLSKCPWLEALNLPQTEVADQDLACLKSMTSLKKLDLNSTRVTEQGMVHLAELKNLEHLRLPNEFTDQGMESIAQLTNLRYLWVGCRSSSPLTDKALASVSQLGLLEELHISGTGFTDAGMDDLAKLKHLKKLNLFVAPISNAGLQKLTALKNLESLDLYQTNVTISGLSQLNNLVHLKWLNLYNIQQDDSGLDISGLVNLEFLGISTPHKDGVIRDKDLACLAKLEKLKWFQIDTTVDKPMAITDTGMAHLSGLNRLERLTIGGPEMTDAGLKYLSGMKNMDLLNLIGGRFTDEGLRCLEGLPSIQYLRFREVDENFSPAALRRLAQSLPMLYDFSVNERQIFLKGEFSKQNTPAQARRGGIAYPR